jgi:5-formyltetrahydrofolate cyclo-ligase
MHLRKMRRWSWLLQSKEQIRARINDKRYAVSDSARNVAAQRALQFFMQNPLFAEHQHIACYLARNEEFDCSPIIRALWQAGKNCYLPVLSTEHDGHLNFVSYHPEDVLRLNRYRILEPEHGEIFPETQLDLVILPLVGFDTHGNRLGMGGGYYDRTFAFLNQRTEKKPLLIGLAYAFQQVHQLPIDAWDVCMHGVLTEEGLVLF